jgi:hypothetical protein
MYEFSLARTLSLSFQRYPYPSGGVVAELPSSWGALPFVHDVPRHLILPCPDGEAFWIGLIPEPGRGSTVVRVLASVASGAWLDVLSGMPHDRSQPTDSADITVPPEHAVVGISRGDGSWWAFTHRTGGIPAPACRGLELISRPGKPAEPPRRAAHSTRQHSGETQDRGRRPPPQLATPNEAAVASDASSVRIDVIEPEEFQALSGVFVPPLDPLNQYGGWRLP